MRPVGTDPTYLALLSKDSGVKMLFGAEILKEYYWPIVTVYNAFQFAVSGDATTLFESGNSIQLSSKKYSEIEVIDWAVYSSASPITNISLSDGVVSSSDLGATVSRIYRVSDRILQESFGDISEDIEGTTLNVFQSSNFNCKLDNSDQWLLNEKTNSGILWTGSELIEITAISQHLVGFITETWIDFTNIILLSNVFKGGVLTVLSGKAKNAEYPIISNTTTRIKVGGTMVDDGVIVGDSLLSSLGAGFNLKLYIGLRQLV